MLAGFNDSGRIGVILHVNGGNHLIRITALQDVFQRLITAQIGNFQAPGGMPGDVPHHRVAQLPVRLKLPQIAPRRRAAAHQNHALEVPASGAHTPQQLPHRNVLANQRGDSQHKIQREGPTGVVVPVAQKQPAEQQQHIERARAQNTQSLNQNACFPRGLVKTHGGVGKQLRQRQNRADAQIVRKRHRLNAVGHDVKSQPIGQRQHQINHHSVAENVQAVANLLIFPDHACLSSPSDAAINVTNPL